jgi:hypothetical protein
VQHGLAAPLPRRIAPAGPSYSSCSITAWCQRPSQVPLQAGHHIGAAGPALDLGPGRVVSVAWVVSGPTGALGQQVRLADVERVAALR